MIDTKATIGEVIRAAGRILDKPGPFHTKSCRSFHPEDGINRYCLWAAFGSAEYDLKSPHDNFAYASRLGIPASLDAWEGPNVTDDDRRALVQKMINYQSE
jgi:hypothetical protein